MQIEINLNDVKKLANDIEKQANIIPKYHWLLSDDDITYTVNKSKKALKSLIDKKELLEAKRNQLNMITEEYVDCESELEQINKYIKEINSYKSDIDSVEMFIEFANRETEKIENTLKVLSNSISLFEEKIRKCL